MKTYYDADADIALLRSRRVAVIGYGSQGHAHALNLRDSGVELRVGLPESARRRDEAQQAGFTVLLPEEAAAWGDVVMLLAPDEVLVDLYRGIEPHLRPGKALAFAHGLAVHFGYVAPRDDVDVILVAPKNSGLAVRRLYQEGSGVPCLIGVHQDVSGQAHALALAYAAGIGAGRVGIVDSSFEEECVLDLFGEQAVMMGGLPALMRAAYDVLVEAGYSPEMAYFRCIHQVKLATDLIAERGIAGMLAAVSNTAAYGGYQTGDAIIGAESKQALQQVLGGIRSGSFAREWIEEQKSGMKRFAAARQESEAHPLEKAGKAVRRSIKSLADGQS